LPDKDYIVCREYLDIQAEESLVAVASPLSTEPEIRPTPLGALALDDPPTDSHFVRSHFAVPASDSRNWTVQVLGAVARPHCYSLEELRRRSVRTQTVVLECAGHRRNEYRPRTVGVQWGAGAVSEARWTGVSVAEMLTEASPSDAACEVVFEGADRGQHRSSSKEVPFARSIPLERALAGDVLLAWKMNGRPIPPKHGAPIRVIVPGNYGVASVKWVRRIAVVDRPFTGPFQTDDYQLNGKPLDELRVNSLIVHPRVAAVLSVSTVEVSGVAWGGRGGIDAVEFRLSGGPWQPTMLRRPHGPSGLTHWSGLLELRPGEQFIEARAHDRAGAMQAEQAEWNALGYANNSIHRLRISVVAAGRGKPAEGDRTAWSRVRPRYDHSKS
jgi:DMSO/TMAO reductase YedYZ molybdopterin-dependent catalytic subunit